MSQSGLGRSYSGLLRRVAVASGLLPGLVGPLDATVAVAVARNSDRVRFRRSSFCFRSRLYLDLSPFNRDIAYLLTRGPSLTFVGRFVTEAIGCLGVLKREPNFEAARRVPEMNFLNREDGVWIATCLRG